MDIVTPIAGILFHAIKRINKRLLVVLPTVIPLLFELLVELVVPLVSISAPLVYVALHIAE